MARLAPLFTWRSAVCSKESGLSSTQRLVALALSLHMSERGDSCYPGQQLLADETGLSEKSVRTAISDLEELGWLHVDRPERQGRGHHNTYAAVIPDTYEAPTKRGKQLPPSTGEKGEAVTTFSAGKVVTDAEKGGSTFPLGPQGGFTRSNDLVQAPDQDDEDDQAHTEVVSVVSRVAIARALADGVYQRPAHQLTRSERGRLEKAALMLAEISATPAQVAAACRAYRDHSTFGRLVITPQAIAANWTELAPPAERSIEQRLEAWVNRAIHRDEGLIEPDLFEELLTEHFAGAPAPALDQARQRYDQAAAALESQAS